MSLAALIHGNRTGGVATAIHATGAIPDAKTRPPKPWNSRIAAIAVANPPDAKTATAAEIAELSALIRQVLADAPDEQEEAITVGLADIEAALICFRSLAADLPAESFPDLPTCQQCRNLAIPDRDGFRRCLAAARGELPFVVSRRYSPVPDLGRRCERFLPKSADPDQRTGRERWPGLKETGKT
jgi:hypothetical protein